MCEGGGGGLGLDYRFLGRPAESAARIKKSFCVSIAGLGLGTVHAGKTEGGFYRRHTHPTGSASMRRCTDDVTSGRHYGNL